MIFVPSLGLSLLGLKWQDASAVIVYLVAMLGIAYVMTLLSTNSLVSVSDRMFYASSDQLAVQRLLSTASGKQAERSSGFSQIIAVPTLIGAHLRDAPE